MIATSSAQGADPQHAASIIVPPDEASAAGLTMRAWPEPPGGVRLIELIAEDTETLARVRLDLSAAQVSALVAGLTDLGVAGR